MKYLARFLFAFIATVSFSSVSFAATVATDTQINSFLEVANEEAKSGEYTGNISVEVPDGNLKMNIKGTFNAEDSELLANFSGNGGMCIGDEMGCVDVKTSGKVYMSLEEGAINIGSLSVDGSGFFAEGIEETMPPQNTWIPIPNYQDELETFLIQSEDLKKENIKKLKVKERALYTQYQFTSEDEESSQKGLLKVYKNGKQKMKVSISPSLEKFESGDYDFLQVKMNLLFTPKSVSNLKPY